MNVLAKNRELIRLKTILPDELNTAEAPERHAPDWQEITRICRENQFNSILKELPEVVPESDSDTDLPEDDLFAFALSQNRIEPEKNYSEECETVQQMELF